MRSPLIFNLFSDAALASSLAVGVNGETAQIEFRRFPDEESYIRYHVSLSGRPVILLAALDRPDEKTLPLLFAAAAARELGATSVGLVSPYLPYMRQDKRFNSGEAVTSEPFAKLLSQAFDWLVTVDPHLHRRHSLSEIYSIPTTVVHAAPLIAEWIKQNVENPLLIGPDAESKQWVASVAELAGADYRVLKKHRFGDNDVKITVRDVDEWSGRTPVIVDDIISTGRTIIETVHHLKDASAPAPICIGIHAIFAADAVSAIAQSGAMRVVTSNTLPDPTNAIDVKVPLIKAILEAGATHAGIH